MPSLAELRGLVFSWARGRGVRLTDIGTYGVAMFCARKLREGRGDVSSSRLFCFYRDWALGWIECVPRKGFLTLVSRWHPRVERRQRIVDGKREWVYHGLIVEGLKPEEREMKKKRSYKKPGKKPAKKAAKKAAKKGVKKGDEPLKGGC